MTRTFTKTEALTRLRQAASLAKQACGVPQNAKTELGIRLVTSVIQTMPTDAYHADVACSPEGDDLNYNCALSEHASRLQIGEVVHVYVSQRDRWGWELYDTICVWVGTADHQPAILDSRFYNY